MIYLRLTESLILYLEIFFLLIKQYTATPTDDTATIEGIVIPNINANSDDSLLELELLL